MIKIVVLILSCLTLCVSAQERFFRKYDKNNDNNFARRINLLTDSTYLLYLNSWDQFNNAFVKTGFIVTDLQGNKLKESYIENLPDHNFPNDILIINDTTVLSVIAHSDSNDVSSVYLYKTFLSGDSIWLRMFGGMEYDLSYEILLLEDNYYLVGYTGSFGPGIRNPYLIKTDILGNLTWQKTYGGTSYDFAYAGNVTIDNHLVLAGRTLSYSTVDEAFSAYVIKVDTAGNQVWQSVINENTVQNIETEAYAIAGASDSGYVIAGVWGPYLSNYSPFLAKIDSGGTVLWTRQFGTDYGLKQNSGGFFEEVKVLDDGTIIAVGANTYMDSALGEYRSDACIWKFNSNGEVIWRRSYPLLNNNWNEGVGSLYDVVFTSDGGFIMCGRLTFINFTQADAIVIKVDSFGCLEPGCQLIDGVNTLADQLLQVKAYPNPSNGDLSFSWNQALQKESTLLISDLTGRTVYTKILHPSETRHNLQKGILKEGMYLYRLHSPGLNSTAGKLIITE